MSLRIACRLPPCGGGRDGPALCVDLPPSATARELAAALEERTGIPRAAMRLAVRGRLGVLSEADGVADFAKSEIEMGLRIRGGGGDGGSIPGRMDLVRTTATHGWYVYKATRDDPSFKVRADWTMCMLTNDKLVEPVMADQLGRFYNKEAIVSYLLKKEKKPYFGHIKRQSDVVNVKATKATTSAEVGDHPLKWVCPVTGKPANGSRPFSLIWGCGCLISDEALEQLGKAICPSCNRQLDTEYNEIVQAAPKEEDIKKQFAQMKERNTILKARRKAEKRKKKAEKQQTAETKTTRETKTVGAAGEFKKPLDPAKKSKKKSKWVASTVKKAAPKRRTSALEQEIQENLKKAKTSKVFSSMFMSKEDFENDERTASTSFISTKPRSMNALV